MSEDGVLAIGDALFEYCHDDVPERLGVVDAAEVYYRVVLHCRAEHFADEAFCLVVDGCSAFYVDYLAEDAGDEHAELALLVGERCVGCEFFGYVAAYSLQLLVEVFCQIVDGVVHEAVEVEAHSSYGLSQCRIDSHAFGRGDVFDYGWYETRGCGHSHCRLGTCSEHNHRYGCVFALGQHLGKLVTEEYLLLHGGVGCNLVGAVVYVYCRLFHLV